MSTYVNSPKFSSEQRVASVRNVAVKTRLHTAHKKLFKAADAGKKDEAEKEFKDFVSGLDKAVKKGVIKKNTANRKKSRAQLKLNKMEAAAAEAAK